MGGGLNTNTSQSANNIFSLGNTNTNSGLNNFGGATSNNLFNNNMNNMNSMNNMNNMNTTQISGTMSLNYTVTQIQEQNNQTQRLEKVNLVSISALKEFGGSKSISELRYEDFSIRKKESNHKIKE